MIVRHIAPKANWTKTDNSLLFNPDISDGALRLLTIYHSLKNGTNVSDEWVASKLNITTRQVGRRKQELKDANLLLIDRLGTKAYMGYVGFDKLPATKVKAIKQSDDNNEAE